MLELKPNCECCDRDLPVDSPDAMISTFECTFCRDCVGILTSIGRSIFKQAQNILETAAMQFPATARRLET